MSTRRGPEEKHDDPDRVVARVAQYFREMLPRGANNVQGWPADPKSNRAAVVVMGAKTAEALLDRLIHYRTLSPRQDETPLPGGESEESSTPEGSGVVSLTENGPEPLCGVMLGSEKTIEVGCETPDGDPTEDF